MGSSAPPVAARTAGRVGSDSSGPARQPAAPLSAGDRAALRARLGSATTDDAETHQPSRHQRVTSAVPSTPPIVQHRPAGIKGAYGVATRWASPTLDPDEPALTSGKGEGDGATPDRSSAEQGKRQPCELTGE
jgi:hypothetical protein